MKKVTTIKLTKVEGKQVLEMLNMLDAKCDECGKPLIEGFGILFPEGKSCEDIVCETIIYSKLIDAGYELIGRKDGRLGECV